MKGLIYFILLIVLIVGFYFFSGMYDVSASASQEGPIDKMLESVAEASVKHHAKGIKVPTLGSQEQIEVGFKQYRQCGLCHGSPGRPQSNAAKHMNPEPPLFTEKGDLSPEELFWVTKNGIKMTGMPAWGSVMSDEEIWSVVALIQKLPDIDSTAWRQMGERLGDTGGTGRMRGMGGPAGGSDGGRRQ